MKKITLKLCLIFSIQMIPLSQSFAFMGMMKNMMGKGTQMMGMGMPMMNSKQMLNMMCNNSMGQAGMGMFNGMSEMMGSMPMFGGMFKGMKNNMSAQVFQQILNSPTETLQALDCAKRNQSMVSMMIKTIESKQQLLYTMGDRMIRDRNVAFSMIDLALLNDQVGRYLMYKVDDILYQQLTTAMEIHPGLAQKVMELMKKHKKEFMHQYSRLAKAISGWNTYESDDDGNEAITERLIYVIFSNVNTANIFLETLESLDQNSKEYFLDLIFLGKNPNHFYDYQNHHWVDGVFINQSYYNLYTICFALKEALFVELKSNHPSKDDFSPAAKKLMGSLMKYMIDHKTKHPTRWGIRFMEAMMAGAHVHRDPEIGLFAGFLAELMPKKFTESLPQPNFEAPAPRKSFK